MIRQTKINGVNIPTVYFGHGSVSMTRECGLSRGQTSLLLKEKEPGPIGELTPHTPKTIGELMPEIILSFCNTESIDAVIEELEIMREYFKHDEDL